MPPKSSPQYVPPYEGVRQQSRIYLRYRDDPWTTKSDPGFKEFYDLGADPYQLRNLAYYREVSQATLDPDWSGCVVAGQTGAGRRRTEVDERVIVAGGSIGIAEYLYVVQVPFVNEVSQPIVIEVGVRPGLSASGA